MHAYILHTHQRISPFDESPGEMRVHNRLLRDVQEETLSACGCSDVQHIDDASNIRSLPCVVVHDDLYFTRAALSGFLRLARSRPRDAGPRTAGDEGVPGPWRNARAALVASELTESMLPGFQGARIERPNAPAVRAFDLYHLEGFDPQRTLAQQSRLVEIPYRLRFRHSRSHKIFSPSGRYSVPLSTVFLHPVRHWAALLTVNMLGMPAEIARRARADWATMATLLARLVWRSGSLRPSLLLGKTYLAGRRCRIHPTAHVEASLLGDRVRIGPGAVVRGAVIGDRAEIGPGAIVEGSTVGHDVLVSGNVMLRGCVVLDDAAIATFALQLSVVGRGAVLCPQAGTHDFSLRRKISVMNSDGRLQSSGSKLLGSCFGHGAFLGPDVSFTAGQSIPNDCILVRDPRTMISSLEAGLPAGIVRLDRGRARPGETAAAPPVEPLSNGMDSPAQPTAA